MGKRRVICELLGCVCTEDYWCDRCGEDVYGAFIEKGRLDPIFRAYGAALNLVWKVTGKKCDVCGRRFRGDDWVCSEKCFTDLLPF